MPEVRAKTSLDQSGFNRGVAGMEKRTDKFAGKLNSLKGVLAGAFSLGAAASMVQNVINMASEISDLATQLGMTTDEFQALEVSALKAGAAKEQVRTVVSKLGIALGNAKGGQESYIRAFKDMGISMEELVRMDVSDALERISQTVANGSEGSAELSAVWTVLGTRAGPQLKEVLLDIAHNGLDGLAASARNAGQIMNAEVIANLDEMADRLQMIKREVGVGGAYVIDFLHKQSSLTPAFAGALAGGANPIEAFRQVVDMNVFGGYDRERKEKHRLAAIDREKRKEDAAEKALARFRAEEGKRQAAAKAAATERAAKEAERREKEAAKRTAGEKARQLREAQRLTERQEAERAREAERRGRDMNRWAEDLARAQETGLVSSVRSDRLAQIGGLVGTTASPEARVAERALKVADQMKRALDDMPAALARELARELGLA